MDQNICINKASIHEQHRLTLTDVVYGAGTELAVELFGSKAPEVMDGEGPEVQHIVPGEGVPLLDHHDLTAQQGQFNGRPQTTRTSADDQTLDKSRSLEDVAM